MWDLNRGLSKIPFRIFPHPPAEPRSPPSVSRRDTKLAGMHLGNEQRSKTEHSAGCRPRDGWLWFVAGVRYVYPYVFLDFFIKENGHI